MNTKPNAARLAFSRGAYRVTLHVDDEVRDLFRAEFEGAAPMVLADDGRVTIEYPRVSPSEWLRPNRRAADVALNPSAAWDFAFGGGVSRLRGDLSGLELSSIEIKGGASEVELVLPKPEGIVPVRIGGGASKVSLLRPEEAPVIVSVAGGVSRLIFDEQRYGAIGHKTRLASPGAEESPDRYEIEIAGGASTLRIDKATDESAGQIRSQVATRREKG